MQTALIIQLYYLPDPRITAKNTGVDIIGLTTPIDSKSWTLSVSQRPCMPTPGTKNAYPYQTHPLSPAYLQTGRHKDSVRIFSLFHLSSLTALLVPYARVIRVKVVISETTKKLVDAV